MVNIGPSPACLVNLLHKSLARAPCTNFSIMRPSDEKMTGAVGGGAVVFSQDLYAEWVPPEAPRVTRTFDEAASEAAAAAGTESDTKHRRCAAHWKALADGEAESIGVCRATTALVYVSKLRLRYVSGSMTTSPCFGHPALADCIGYDGMPSYPVLVQAQGENGTAAVPSSAWHVQCGAGLLQFWSADGELTSPDGTSRPLFSTSSDDDDDDANAVFTPSRCPLISFWRYVGAKGVCSAVSHDAATDTTTIRGRAVLESATVARDVQVDGTLRCSGAASLDDALNVAGACTLLKDLRVRGAADVQELRSSGPVGGASFTTSGGVCGATLRGETCDVGACAVRDRLQVGGEAEIRGPARLSGGVEGDLELSGSLHATGAMSTAGELHAGSFVCEGQLRAPRISADTLEVGECLGLKVPEGHELSALGPATFGGDVTMDRSLALRGGVKGPVTFHGHVAVAAGKALRVAGKETTELGGGLRVGGRAKLADGIEGPLAVHGSLAVGGAVTAEDNLTLAAGKCLLLRGGGRVVCDAAGSGEGGGGGINFSSKTSTQHGIYMAKGGGTSFSGGVACCGGALNGYALRSRMPRSAGGGFIWENAQEEALMSLDSAEGTLTLPGAAELAEARITKSLCVTGTAQLRGCEAEELRVSGACSLLQLTVDGGAGLRDVTVAGELRAKGTMTALGDLEVLGGCGVQGLSVKGEQGLSVEGGVTKLREVEVTGLCALRGPCALRGGLNVERGLTHLGGNLTVSGPSTVGTLNVGGALNVSGLSTLAGDVAISGGNCFTVEKGLTHMGGNLTVTGRSTHVQSLTCGSDLSVSGPSVLEDVTIMGDLTVRGGSVRGGEEPPLLLEHDAAMGAPPLRAQGVLVSGTEFQVPEGTTQCSVTTGVVVTTTATAASPDRDGNDALVCWLRLLRVDGDETVAPEGATGTCLMVRGGLGAGTLCLDTLLDGRAATFRLGLQVQRVESASGAAKDLSEEAWIQLHAVYRGGHVALWRSPKVSAQ